MKKYFAILLCLGLPLVCCGCFPTTQLEERAIVQAAAVDYTNDSYAVTLQVFDPSQSGENAGGSDAFVLLEGSGATLSQAFEAAAQKGKEIYLGSCRTLLVGGNALRRLEGILNYFNSRPQTRATMLVACTAEKSADFLKGTDIKPSPAVLLEQELMLAQKEKRLPQCRMMDILGVLQDPTRHALLPVLVWKEKEKAPLLEGGLLFREDSVDLHLSKEELAVMGWLERGRGNLLIELEEYPGTAILLEAFTPHIAVDLQDGLPQINLRLTAKGRVSEYGEQTPDQLEQPQLEQLQQAAAQQMAAQLKGFMEKLCQAGCDPLRLGQRLERSHPRQWAQVKQSWPTSLQQAGLSVAVGCRITTYSGK